MFNSNRQTKIRTAIIVGASRGTGLELSKQLAESGVDVIALGRSGGSLESLAKGVEATERRLTMLKADGTDETVIASLLENMCPDLIVLAGGTQPQMAPVSQQSWDSFSASWNNDTKMSFLWSKALLNQNVSRPVTLVSLSSGASINGSPLSGGYAGAKRMQSFLMQYAQNEANQRNLPVSFVTIIPKQLLQGTKIAHAAASSYARLQGKTVAEFMAQWPKALTPNRAAQMIFKILTQSSIAGGVFCVNSEGVEILE